MSDTVLSEHDELRPLMFAIAYRMLGSVSDAEDIVQDAFVRMHEAAPDEIRSAEAYATTVTTRLAIDQLRSARVRRERYVGQWLPEPLVTSADEDPAVRAEQVETLSMAFLVLLERLGPVERAVFVLREVFDYEYSRIADIIGKSEANCRQVFVRAQRRLGDDRPRFEPDPARRDELAGEFLAASQTGDLDRLERILADDVVFFGDGGGKAAAVSAPVEGLTRVARFVHGIFRQLDALGGRAEPLVVNGQPGARFVDGDGRLGAVIELTIVDGRVREIRNVLNPDKLRHLGPLVDPATLPRAARYT